MATSSYRIVNDFFDSPEVLDASVTAIPGKGSPTLQVVAQLSGQCNYVRVIDGIGQFVGVYFTPPGGQEQLGCIVGGGAPHEVKCYIPAKSKISLRSMEVPTISSGSISIQFPVEDRS